MSPNFEHVKHAAQWKESYPAATLYGCPAGPYSPSLFHRYFSRFIPDPTLKKPYLEGAEVEQKKERLSDPGTRE